MWQHCSSQLAKFVRTIEVDKFFSIALRRPAIMYTEQYCNLSNQLDWSHSQLIWWLYIWPRQMLRDRFNIAVMLYAEEITRVHTRAHKPRLVATRCLAGWGQCATTHDNDRSRLPEHEIPAGRDLRDGRATNDRYSRVNEILIVDLMPRITRRTRTAAERIHVRIHRGHFDVYNRVFTLLCTQISYSFFIARDRTS